MSVVLIKRASERVNERERERKRGCFSALDIVVKAHKQGFQIGLTTIQLTIRLGCGPNYC